MSRQLRGVFSKSRRAILLSNSLFIFILGKLKHISTLQSINFLPRYTAYVQEIWSQPSLWLFRGPDERNRGESHDHLIFLPKNKAMKTRSPEAEEEAVIICFGRNISKLLESHHEF